MDFKSFLELQYKLNNLSKDNLKLYVPLYISEEEYQDIIKEK